jgi:cardiolipin synthase
LEGLLGVPATEGNRVEALRNGDEIFPAMLDAIRAAERTIDLLSYIYWTGDVARQFGEACRDRARAGVRVRILLDAVGAKPMADELIEELTAAGVLVEWFRPPATWKVWETNHRTHRKVLVCDESVAFIGGVGIAKPWEGNARNAREWRDTHFRVRGPAVDGLRAAFASNWAETGQPLFTDVDRFPDQPRPGDAVVQVVRGEGETGWTDIWTVYRTLIEVAQRRLRITTAYFVPGPMLQESLMAAARRGVQVEILVPGRHMDKPLVRLNGQDAYDRLLEAGVRIYQYRRTMLHAKVITVDEVASFVGSANFDRRSSTLNEEANLLVLDEPLAAELDRHFEDDRAGSREIDLERWRGRPKLHKLAERAIQVADPLMCGSPRDVRLAADIVGRVTEVGVPEDLASSGVPSRRASSAPAGRSSRPLGPATRRSGCPGSPGGAESRDIARGSHQHAPARRAVQRSAGASWSWSLARRILAVSSPSCLTSSVLRHENSRLRSPS